MSVCILINSRADFLRITDAIGGEDLVQYASAAKGLEGLTETAHALITIVWRVYPGRASGDEDIDLLARALPRTEYNENLVYWQILVRVIQIIRGEDSANSATPVVVSLPLVFTTIVADFADELTPEGIAADARKLNDVEILYGLTPEDLGRRLQDRLKESH
jgi:hypothetical protein